MNDNSIIQSDIIYYLSYFIPVLTIIITFKAITHVILNKRDPRSAMSWVGIISLIPLLGVTLYLIFGINRIKRRAKQILFKNWKKELTNNLEKDPYHQQSNVAKIHENFPEFFAHNELVSNLTHSPLTCENQIEIYGSGDAAYEEMLKQINSAKFSIVMETYIFQNDEVGKKFVDAFQHALQRKVEVKLIIDDIGSKYSIPSIYQYLNEKKIKFAKFLPSWIPWHMTYMNLRNHRKILIIDGRIGFIGGMNISAHHAGEKKIQDIHFKINGPVVKQLMDIFATDWYFCKRKKLSGPHFYPLWEDLKLSLHKQISTTSTNVIARAISDGPDEDFELLKRTIISAINMANHSINIVNPYFLPDLILILILESALLRQIKVNIVIPEINNIIVMRWAQDATLHYLLEKNANIYLSAPPFDHSKLFVIDNKWSLIGSANFDTRSLRLNFESNLEIYSEEFAQKINSIIDQKIKQARPLTLNQLKNRPYFTKIRDGVARLFSPYL